MRAPAIILPAGVDPPGLRRAPQAPDIFAHEPHRNRGMAGIANDCSTLEWDNRIIATAVSLGCPRWKAEQARTHPPARFALLKVWCWVQDAAEGDPTAKECLNIVREAFDKEARLGPDDAVNALVER